MSEISSSFSSTSRITGIFSELDTDKIVEDLLKAQSTKVDTRKQDNTSFQWYNEALKGIDTKLKDFKNSFLNTMGSNSMVKSTVYRSFSVSTSGATTAATITASTGASPGSMTIDSITQLAENASVSSGSRISSDGKEISSSNTAKLSELNFATKLTFNSEKQISFGINGSAFTFDSDTTLQSMINTINADEKAGVTIKYSRLTDAFTITADEGGASSKVTVENISGNAFGDGGAFGIGEGSTVIAGYGKQGQNAVCSIEGVTVTRDSNVFTIDGINYTLNEETSEALNFTVKNDTSATVEAVKTFIEAYNELMGELNDLYTQKDLSDDFPPLTEAQEEDMSDEQIESWNEKAKSGLLRRNSELRSFLSSMKDAFFSNVGGTGATMASIGITSASYFSSDAGKILVDEDALTAAIESNPEKVITMFTNSAGGEEGLVYKISDAVNSYIGEIKDDTKDTESKINKLDIKIEKMEEELDSMAERYYKRFSAMETAMSKLNSMSSMLASMFSA